MPFPFYCVIQEALFLQLRHKNWILFNTISLRLFERVKIVISANVRVFRFHDFVFVNVGLLIFQNLILKYLRLGQRLELIVVVNGSGRLLGYIFAVIVHFKLVICLFRHLQNSFFGHVVVNARRWHIPLPIRLYCLLSRCDSFPGVQLILILMTMQKFTLTDLTPIFNFGI